MRAIFPRLLAPPRLEVIHLAGMQAFFIIFDEVQGEHVALFAMVLWQIWKDRNTVVWKEIFPNPDRSVATAVGCRQEWLLARARGTRQHSALSSSAVCLGWHDLSEGDVLCGVDAAFFEGDNAMGLGLVFGDHSGNFLTGTSLKIPGMRSIEEGEVLGIKEVFSWIQRLGYVSGIVELDSKRACNEITSGGRNISEFGLLAKFCREELSMLPGFCLRHVRCDQNVIAHGLAKAARDL
ncbi:uncharacterized protein LOC130998115 [Salvia miltiorrhiza]|uniref:uncharacterized protein LOC130998115 n=1 Tax=Salvia miltiorrhiza TaxID=226208 RepID=UPI0025ACF108|nr:uncharacterized protein LOC130998115 [Salvia miltiorrhiza]